MKKTFWKIAAMAMAVLLSPLTVNAGTCYEDCMPCDPCAPKCGTTKSLWEVGGWIDAGIARNQYGQENVYATTFVPGQLIPVSGNTFLLQNVRQSDFQVNQAWGYFGKKLSKRGFDIGGRIDAMYGTDGLMLQSYGFEVNADGSDPWGTGDYYFALPQAYAEVGYNNLSVKLGKFLSPMGYESIMSPDRFFYSLSYAYAMNPQTMTGAIATWDMTKKFSVFGGWYNGENPGTLGFGRDLSFVSEDSNAGVFGAKWNGDRLGLAYTGVIGKYKDYFAPGVDYKYFLQSVVADWKITKRTNYVFEWTVRNDSAGSFDEAGAYGLNNELFYQLTKKWTVGLRGEWMRYYNGGLSDDILAFTAGLNWKPSKWFTLKGEARYDVCDNATPFNMFGDSIGTPTFDAKGDQWTFGLSGVVHF